MIVITTPSIEGQRTTRCQGIMTGGAILGADLRVLFAPVPAFGTAVSLVAV